MLQAYVGSAGTDDSYIDVFTAVVRSQSLVVADQQRVEKQRHVGAVAAVEITPGNTIT